MTEIGRHVDAHAAALQHREILGERLEVPPDAGAQGVEGHAFDLGQVAHRHIAVGGTAGRDREAAIADDDRRDAERRRRRDERVPGELGVVVGVAVDDAGRQREAVAGDGLAGSAEIVADGGDDAIAHGDIGADGRRPGAVDDRRAG